MAENNPKDIFVNDLKTSLKDSIRRMEKEHVDYFEFKYRNYGERLNKLFKTKNWQELYDRGGRAIALRELKDKTLESVKREIGETFMIGKIPVMCRDGIVRHYKPEQYTMLMARTGARDMREMGLHQKMTDNGLDLVVISSHKAKDPCRFWENKVLSITGQTKGYTTVEEARSTGEIFHFNCAHHSSPFMAYKDETGKMDILGRDFDDWKATKKGRKIVFEIKEAFKRKAMKNTIINPLKPKKAKPKEVISVDELENMIDKSEEII